MKVAIILTTLFLMNGIANGDSLGAAASGRQATQMDKMEDMQEQIDTLEQKQRDEEMNQIFEENN